MKNRIKRILALFFVLLLPMLSACGSAGEIRATESYISTENQAWSFGFGRRQILPDPESDEPLYIAGYNTAAEIEGVLDYCEARAIWIDAGGEGVLLIGVDCVALDSGVVGQIREKLKDIENCASVHVYSTHTHAGADTLGLWGPTAVDGKNSAYMESLIEAAAEAGREAAENSTAGKLYYGYVETDAEEMLRDSRIPMVFDAKLHQLRFEAEDSSAGLRMYFYCAHAESLRSVNRKLSRDYPGILCDTVTEKTGDNTMFLPGAVGGLLMTKEFVPTDTQADAEENLHITGEKIVSYALSISEETERELAPTLAFARTVFTVPLDNTGFQLFRFLGILSNKAVRGQSATGYLVETELSVLQLGDLALALIPGEIFPELVYGGVYGDANPNGVNPQPLCEIASEFGFDTLLVVGLANDELGYIVPPSDFLLNKNMPYIEKTMDYKGENHYEETNSVGLDCADAIAAALRAAFEAVSEK
ncbi:MAG: hypothetical protein IJF56_03485 [Clostridia bacterium]|nr:hypothetical protein [Clostridia bacterium]